MLQHISMLRLPLQWLLSFDSMCAFQIVAPNFGQRAATGWHVPTKAEVVQLLNYAGLVIYPNLRTTYSGGNVLMESGTSHWGCGTNSTGLSGLPNGIRSVDASFVNKGIQFRFWSASNEEFYLDCANGGLHLDTESCKSKMDISDYSIPLISH